MNKINCLKNIRSFLIILFALFISVQKIHAEKSICFEVLCFTLTGDCDKTVLPKPAAVNELGIFFNRSYYEPEDKSFHSYIQKYFPEGETVIESSGLYSAETDSGSWIDRMLFEMEETRLAAQIDALNQEGNSLSQDLNDSYGEDLNPEIVFTDKNSNLSSMEFENEVLLVQQEGDFYVKISSSEKETLREYYDKAYRLVTRESWEIKDVANSKLNSKEQFVYNSDSLRPIKKTVVSDKSRENFIYNDKGLTTSYKKYVILEKGSKLLEKQNWKYDSDDRITEYVKVTNTYKDDTYKKLEDTFEQKRIFLYNEWENIPPDEEYYEDNVLKQRTKYSETAGTYTTQFFFDNDYSVKTYYKNNEKTREVYTLKGEVWRVKEYEKK